MTLRPVPRSLAGRTVLVLVAGLLVTHALSMLVYSHERLDALTMLGGHGMAQRVANVAHMVADVPPEWRPRVVRGMDEPTFRVGLTPDSVLVAPDAGDWRARTIREFIMHQLHDTRFRSVRVQLLDRPQEGERFGLDAAFRWLWTAVAGLLHGAPPGQSLRVSLEMGNGQWLNIAANIPGARNLWSGPAFLSTLSMTVLVLALSVWVVRRLVAPLRGFAEAAERLGRDVNAPPLAEDGPSEVRQAARAFNGMQERLRRLIGNRTRMLAAISHDLRTPLTLLRLRAEMLDESDERTRMLATLDEMEAMIAATLAFAREDGETETPRTVDLAALVESLCADLADAGRPVTFHGPARLPYPCRPLALKRAIANLVDNALKYGGRAGVTLSDDVEGPRIAVEDDGPGIPEEQLADVFAPFVRVEASRSPETGGVGLGLAVAQGAVEGHGGEVTLANRAEGGLRATIRLPGLRPS